MPSTTATTASVSTTSFRKSIILYGHNALVTAVVVLKNGDLASADAVGTIIIWDSITYQIKKNLTDLNSWIFYLAVLQNGDLVSGSGTQNFKIEIWDIVTGIT
jgi:WD40 repeat protein